MDEIKKENFDLKLRVYHLEDRLRQMAPSNVDNALKENVELKVQNEALMAEIKSHQEIISEAQTAIEQYRQQNASRPGDTEIARLRQELEQTVQQLSRSQSLCQKYEGQLALFDKESRETAQRMKQGELELNGLQKRLLDSQHTIERYEEEIKGLEEELESKNSLIHQFKVDSQGMAQELELISKQMGELQDALRSTQAERDNLVRERDSIKRTTLNEVAKQTGMSPRSSLDLLESKLMRELGQATKRLQDLEKQTEMTHTEKEQLMGQSQTLASNLEQATMALKHLGTKISTTVGMPLMVSSTNLTFPDVFEQVEQCTDHLIRDYSEQRTAKNALAEQVTKQEQLLNAIQSEKQHFELEVHRAEGKLVELQNRISVREEELRRAHEAAADWQRKATSVYDGELPQLREQVGQLRVELGKLQGELDLARAELSRSNDIVSEYKSKWEEAQSIAIQASSESSDRLAHISQLQQSRADLAKRLAGAEELAQSLNRKLEESKAQLDHADRVKAAVEEGFNRQLKALHSTNTELKMQLATNSSGATDAQARLERLNAAMETLRAEKDGLFNRLQNKEHAIGSLQQELENLRHEKRKMETDLSLRDEQLRKAENDLTRLRKDDMMTRKNSDGLAHLQAKVESLNALNAFLREQTEQKEKHIRDLEDRLRRQADEMRTTMAEVEQQSRKLKKREQLISQALKRLESINSLQLTADSLGLNQASNFTSSLGVNHLSAPAEELTPIRPSKLPFTSTGANPPSNLNKENRFTSNYEF